jgi:toxin YxiD
MGRSHRPAASPPAVSSAPRRARRPREEGRRAAAAGEPYAGDVGHVPDTTWVGKPDPPSWQDLTEKANKSLGAQARNYPVGYKPTRFLFEE